MTKFEWVTEKVSDRVKVTFYTRKKPKGGESMARKCKLHTGPLGGKFRMHRKKGGGVKKVYV